MKQNEFTTVDWVMLSNLSWDMQECMRNIIRSDKIVKIKEILDPSVPEEGIGYQIHDVNRFLQYSTD